MCDLDLVVIIVVVAIVITIAIIKFVPKDDEFDSL